MAPSSVQTGIEPGLRPSAMFGPRSSGKRWCCGSRELADPGRARAACLEGLRRGAGERDPRRPGLTSNGPGLLPEPRPASNPPTLSQGWRLPRGSRMYPVQLVPGGKGPQLPSKTGKLSSTKRFIPSKPPVPCPTPEVLVVPGPKQPPKGPSGQAGYRSRLASRRCQTDLWEYHLEYIRL